MSSQQFAFALNGHHSQCALYGCYRYLGLLVEAGAVEQKQKQQQMQVRLVAICTTA